MPLGFGQDLSLEESLLLERDFPLFFPFPFPLPLESLELARGDFCSGWFHGQFSPLLQVPDFTHCLQSPGSALGGTVSLDFALG